MVEAVDCNEFNRERGASAEADLVDGLVERTIHSDLLLFWQSGIKGLASADTPARPGSIAVKFSSCGTRSSAYDPYSLGTIVDRH
ncbi:hypothetical protein Aph01nite_08260 [Acrocarpospora phusangensis]|uniref:Uncharacterized protein n=1 Tax=Acrocarpospora phusangensis TaxID=1070424 RepID=A0A919UIC0_9ACTN|nr:hypothetical protein Aph01nite_08260 [Acrocarpospora phusangensis]